jgi:8-oxo-dGTP pyrophosphatase MutT (NUDIX family)
MRAMAEATSRWVLGCPPNIHRSSQHGRPACATRPGWLPSPVMSSTLPPAAYYATLPKSITGAGVILHDPDGRVLLVEPAYRADKTWEIPGGGLEGGEYPWDAAAREVKEELGLTLSPGRLLVVDWVPPQPDGRPALSNFLFDGGTITEQQAHAQLLLPPEELTSWRLATADEWPQLLAPHMLRRVQACVEALATGSTAYLHHGWPPPTVPNPAAHGLRPQPRSAS